MRKLPATALLILLFIVTSCNSTNTDDIEDKWTVYTSDFVKNGIHYMATDTNGNV